ncbi:MAG: response regulator transcription factor [Acidobacteriota bacterium]|nr:response regulator transcription factor [Acidobacteriota bacterium]
MARIFIVDDHEPFRKKLRLLIEAQEDWEVCCEAADGTEAVDKHCSVKPHLTIMDFNMPGLDGLRASRKILANCPKATILMITVFASRQLADEAKRVGIKGFCSKINVDCITEAITTVLAGKTYFPESFLQAGA